LSKQQHSAVRAAHTIPSLLAGTAHIYNPPPRQPRICPEVLFSFINKEDRLPSICSKKYNAASSSDEASKRLFHFRSFSLKTCFFEGEFLKINFLI